MSTTETYRALRRTDPYLSARSALALARDDHAAREAGMTFLEREGSPVVVDGETFTLAVEDDDVRDYGDMGSVEERPVDRDYVAPYCYGPVPPWPCVALPAGYDGSGTQSGYFGPCEHYFDPGPGFDADWTERGMARGPGRERTRALLVAEGVARRKVGAMVGLALADEAGNAASLWGVELSGEWTTADRAYCWSVVRELADEIRADRAEAAEREARATFERLAMASPHG